MSERVAWEYRVIDSSVRFEPDWWSDRDLDPAGAEGWEAVTAIPLSDQDRILLNRLKVEGP